MSQTYCKVENCRFPESHVTSAHRCGKCKHSGHGQIECGKKDLIKKLKNMNDEPFPHMCSMDICHSRNTHTLAAHTCDYFGCGKNHLISDCPIIHSEHPRVRLKCPICRDESFNYMSIVATEENCSVCMEHSCNIKLECGHECLCSNCFHTINNSQHYGIKLIKPDDSMIKQINDMLNDKMGKIYAITYGGMGSCVYGKRDRPGGHISYVMMCTEDWGQYRSAKHELQMDKRGALYRFLRGYKSV